MAGVTPHDNRFNEAEPTLADAGAIVPYNPDRTPPVWEGWALDAAAVPSPRMPTTDARALAHQLKVWLTGLSAAAFIIITGLVAGHVVGVTAPPAAGGATQQPAGTNAGATSTNTGTNTGDNGSFFNQQPGGYGIGSSTQQAPVSGTRVS